MGTAYSDQSGSASAYNSSPPPDDGTTVAANKITWANDKSKIGDPLKAYADAINTALLTTLNFSSTQQTTNYTTQASDNMQTIEIPSGSPTISLGDAATMTKNYIVTILNLGTGAPVIALATAANTLNGATNGTFTFPSGFRGSYTFKVNNGATGYYTQSSGLLSFVKRKSSDQTVSGTTLTNDSDLLFPIFASEEWSAEFFLDCGGTGNFSVAGMKVAITTPVGATLNVVADVVGSTKGDSISGDVTSSGTAIDFTTASFSGSGTAVVRVSIWVLNGATAGNVTLQWSQSTSSGNRIVKKGSHMYANRIA